MPQLNPADFLPQLVWLAITFTGLYLVMAKLALPRVAEVLEERQDRIADDLDAASTMKQEAEEVLKAYEAALEEARAKAHVLAMEAHAKVVAEGERRSSELAAKLGEQGREAAARIAAARDEALATVGEVAAGTAQAVVAHLIGVEVSDKIATAAVKAELAARREAGA